MSKPDKEESVLDKLSRMAKERGAKVEQQNMEDIPRSSQIVALVIHLVFITLFFFQAQTNPYNNWLALFMCFYLTCALIFLAFKFQERLQTLFSTATRMILAVTIVGLAVGFFTYHSPIGEHFEHKQLNTFFEDNKTLIGEGYYNTYLQNKDNLEQLKELRQRVNQDLKL